MCVSAEDNTELTPTAASTQSPPPSGTIQLAKLLALTWSHCALATLMTFPFA